MDAASLTQALYNAFCTNKPLDMKACSGVLNDYESAYAVQRKFAELKGEPTGGYKISLTSKTTQDMFGTTEPLFGEQTKSHIFAAPCTLELDHMNEPLIEVELSMIPKVDLTSSMSDEELLENITVAGGIEVPDARFEAWFPTLNKYLVVADCAVGGCIIHGTPVDGKTLTVAGLNAIRCELFKTANLSRQAIRRKCSTIRSMRSSGSSPHSKNAAVSSKPVRSCRAAPSLFRRTLNAANMSPATPARLRKT